MQTAPLGAPPGVHLHPFTPVLAAAYQQGLLAAALNLPALPKAWPTFPEGLAPQFAADPPAKGPHWGPWLFLRSPGGDLLGNGGFYGAPQGGCIELGYEIAPIHRGRGWAQAAVRAMLALAWADPTVEWVLAHTLAEENPSTGVLKATGFAFDGERADDEVGRVWRWRLNRP